MKLIFDISESTMETQVTDMNSSVAFLTSIDVRIDSSRRSYLIPFLIAVSTTREEVTRSSAFLLFLIRAVPKC